MSHLLKVDHLSVNVFHDKKLVPLVQDVSFEIEASKTVSLIGESGSGKSLTALSILRILPQTMCIDRDSRILLNGLDLLNLPEIKMRKIRGGQIAIIFQDLMTSFNPVMTIGDQISEALKLHQKLKGKILKRRVESLLEQVQLIDVDRIYRSYPHQLSGGMKQRAMIAMALTGDPKLLIADEPTTALDVTTETEVLALLKNLQQQLGMAILFITHDLNVAKSFSDTIVILQNGSIKEKGTVHDIFNHPKNPYTIQLLNASPKKRVEGLIKTSIAPLLSVQKVKMFFPIKKGFLNRIVGFTHAVDDVSFEVNSGETVAIVGESGSGKSTLAKGIVDLLPLTDGQIYFKDNTIHSLKRKEELQLRKDIQIIMQDPFSAMNPRLRIKDIIEEGMLALNVGGNEKERQNKIDELLLRVGLKPEQKFRFPHEFSGGQRQRICIARALAVNPLLIVCDEPTSSLDVTIEAQIIDLLIELQQDLKLSYVFITHNLKLLKTLAHRILVMQQGKIVEEGDTQEILSNPKNPYTKTLLASIPKAFQVATRRW